MNTYRRILAAVGLVLAGATTAGAEAPAVGGMGGPHFRLTYIAGSPTLLGGGPAYLILDSTLYLGLSGSYMEGNLDEFFLAYLGPSAGYLLFPDSWASLWLAGTAALGALSDPAAGESGVLVLEPEAALMLALGPYCKLGLGASYRLVVPFQEIPGCESRELSGFAAVARLHYGVFRPEPGSSPAGSMPPLRLGIAGCLSQKFSLLRGQLVRFDGGYTRVIFNGRFAIGAMGYRTPGSAKIENNDFQMMESGLWSEYFFGPSGWLSLSLGALTGIALIGYMTPADELVGSPAFLFNPEVQVYLKLANFVRLSASIGFRLAAPFQEIPLMSFWDYSGPTASLNLVFGVF